MQKRGKRARPMEFSKKLLIAAYVLALFVVVYACALMWRTGDASPLAYLIPGVLAELAVGTGFYYKKAERENEIKLGAIYKRANEDE